MNIFDNLNNEQLHALQLGLSQQSEAGSTPTEGGQRVANFICQAFSLPRLKAREGETNRQRAIATGDFATLTTVQSGLSDVHLSYANYDSAWQAVFRDISNTVAVGEDRFEVSSIDGNGVVFSEIQSGSDIKTVGVSGSTVEAKFVGYGLTIEFLRDVLLYNRQSQVVDQLRLAMIAYYRSLAQIHYTLIAKATEGKGSNSVVPYDGTGKDPLDKDINTLNNAYLGIGNALKDKGYDGIANAEFVVYYHPTMDARLRQVVNRTVNDGGGGNILSWNSRMIKTWSKYLFPDEVSRTNIYVVLPGDRIRTASKTPQPNSTMWKKEANQSTCMTSVFDMAAIVAEKGQVQLAKFA